MIDGIFYSGDQFFRFYKDGTFLDCLIKGSGDYSQVKKWLSRDNPLKGVLKGAYSMKGDILTFQTLGHFGDGKRSTHYTGKFKDNVIAMTSINHSNGRTLEEKFVRLG